MRITTTTAFSADQQRDFIEGWKNAGGYVDDLGESPAPWCCPWYYMKEIEVSGTTFQEWGASWWNQCKTEIEKSLKKMEA